MFREKNEEGCAKNAWGANGTGKGWPREGPGKVTKQETRTDFEQ